MSKDKSLSVSDAQIQSALTDESIKKPAPAVIVNAIRSGEGLLSRIDQTVYLKSNYGHQPVVLKQVGDKGLTISDGSINKFIPWHLVPEITY